MELFETELCTIVEQTPQQNKIIDNLIEKQKKYIKLLLEEREENMTKHSTFIQAFINYCNAKKISLT